MAPSLSNSPASNGPALRKHSAQALQSERPVVLSIVIANYNGCDLLAGCLASIYQHPPKSPFEVIVVDDASSDGSDDMVKEQFPQVHLLKNEVNVHYARSNNRALEIAAGRYVYLLNNDTLVLPGALDALIAFLDEHPSAGAVGNKLLNGDGTIQWSVKSLPCVMAGFFGARSILTKLFPNNPFTPQHLLHLSHDMTHPFMAGYVSSASIMIRQEVVRRVGHLDERLSYHVDADYCKRIWDAGWSVYYLPSAAVIHLNHQGGTMVSPRRRFKSVVEFHRGSYIFFRKHQMKSPWHPMHLLVVSGLGLRFVLSMTHQLLKECFTPLVERSPGQNPGRDGPG
jgi:GT2 family glycosyltransferase